jgi:hypothetical protein
MRRVGRFLRTRGSGNTLAFLSLVSGAALGFAVVTRTVWELPLLSNCFWVVVAVCVVCGGACYWKLPSGGSSEETTELLTDPAPDPAAQGKGSGNVDDTGPTIVVPRGSKNKVPRNATVWVDPEDDGGDGSKTEEDPPG